MSVITTATRWIGGFFPSGRTRASNPYPASTVDEQHPARPGLSLDQKDWLSRQNLEEIRNSTRHIFNVFPAVSGAIRDIASNVVGHHWQAQYKGTDPRFERVAEKYLENWYKVCDVRGAPYTMQTDLRTMVITLLRDGEFFLHLTNQNGFPSIQFLESHRVGTRWDESFKGQVIGGRFDGLPQRNGVAYNRYSRAVAYHYLGDSPELDEWIPAGRLIHVFDPEWFSQGRGISPLVYCVLDLLDVDDWRTNELTAQRMLSAIGLIEHNEDAGPDTLQDRMRRAAGKAPEPNKPKRFIENFQSGMTRFFKINGGNIKALETSRPSANQANFEERIMRGCFRSLGWSYEQAINSKGQTGANVRRDLAQNQKTVEHWQGVLKGCPWVRCVVYALAAADANDALVDDQGKVELPNDWYLWRPQLPPRMTVDYGRDRRADLEELRTGARTMIQDIRDRGGDERTHIRDQIKFYQIKKAEAESAGITRKEWLEVFGSLLYNPTVTLQEQEEDDEDEDSEAEQEEEELNAKADE